MAPTAACTASTTAGSSPTRTHGKNLISEIPMPSFPRTNCDAHLALPPLAHITPLPTFRQLHRRTEALPTTGRRLGKYRTERDWDVTLGPRHVSNGGPIQTRAPVRFKTRVPLCGHTPISLTLSTPTPSMPRRTAATQQQNQNTKTAAGPPSSGRPHAVRPAVGPTTPGNALPSSKCKTAYPRPHPRETPSTTHYVYLSVHKAFFAFSSPMQGNDSSYTTHPVSSDPATARLRV